ncbi:alpha/beta hydrolase [Nocardioides guangzhouensis]|uniref:Alpha/beta hydrolase n=1 Tax=Nocardioides guangzhouensis TaxID=2497878 RepID=A0A4Q4ZMA3_9ACTN|nr:alpha/beta hydrolase [Nocardioides guangzhouensis]RYP88666.1 alpha/beta hydrolase [Nocardioides guangzhouensis]
MSATAEINSGGDDADTGTVIPRPLILVRGFGGVDVDDERRNAYQGFNEGTVYPGRRGQNFIYEGFVLRALKSPRYQYTDATNVVGYYSKPIDAPSADIDLGGFAGGDVGGDTVVIDPSTAKIVLANGLAGTIWVYRYYDLDPRSLANYGRGLARLIYLIEAAAGVHKLPFQGVDVVAHSMGGLVVRDALHQMDAAEKKSAERLVHKIVTLGTPHRGIAFQVLPRWLVSALPKVGKAKNELAAFDPDGVAFNDIANVFPMERILTVVGTNYRTYNVGVSSLANRLSSLFDEGTLATNKSDGLVKQAAAQLPGAPRTFVNKCHGGPDSLVTSREAYEISMRFLNGTHRVRLWLDEAEISRGKDWFGKSEFYFGASIKPRGLDFELFHQSAEAENCYGPFRRVDLADGPYDLAKALTKPLSDPGDDTTWWAGPDRLIWDGWIDERDVLDPSHPDMVFRLDLYVGERDSRGFGFSDNVIFRKQYYVQAFPGSPIQVFVHTNEELLGPRADRSVAVARTRAAGADSTDFNGVVTESGGPSPAVQRAAASDTGWRFQVAGTGFTATLRVGIERISQE